MDYFLLIVALLLAIPLLRWSARIEARNAEAEDERAMQRCKEADERSLKESVERVAKQSVYVSKHELETQEAAAVEEDTQLPNPFEETFDAFDEWYLEEFGRIG